MTPSAPPATPLPPDRRAVAVLIACYNRREQTLAALADLGRQELPADVALTVFLVDDGSTDGTAATVRSAFPAVRILTGDGTLFWNGAMVKAQQAALAGDFAFHLWLNDDVSLEDDAIARLIALHDGEIAAGRSAPIVVGWTIDATSGAANYGGHVRRPGPHPFRFLRVVADERTPSPCDIFNGNCLLVPRPAFLRLGTIDPAFSGGQPLGDTDYGLRAGLAGIPMLMTTRAVGRCPDNPRTSPWQDAALPFGRRIRSLTGPLGPARRQSMHFYRRHGGPAWWAWWLVHVGRCAVRAIHPSPRRRDKPHLAMIEPVLPWYRLGLVTRLRDRGVIAFRLFFGTSHPRGEPSAPPPPGVDFLCSPSVHYPFGPPRVLWCAHVWAVLTGRFDVVLMAEHLFTLSNWMIWLGSRLIGRPRVILTGHFSLDRRPGGLLGVVRRAWVRGADFVAPYTPNGAAQCRRIGVAPGRIQILYNTLDVEAIRQTIATAGPLPADERRRLDVDDRAVFLLIGRLYANKRAGLVLEAVERLNHDGMAAVLLVVGDGEDAAALRRRQAAGAPLRMVGACRDPRRLAGYFGLARALVMPDAAGLAVNQAFAHGVPVILGPGRHHGVEADYVEHGRNGLIATEPGAAGLAAPMRRLLEQPDLEQRLRAGASATADRLGMDGYVCRLEALIERAAHD